MVADHIILVVALGSWTFCDNAGTVHIVVIDNSEVNLEMEFRWRTFEDIKMPSMPTSP